MSRMNHLPKEASQSASQAQPREPTKPFPPRGGIESRPGLLELGCIWNHLEFFRNAAPKLYPRDSD